MIRQDPQSKIGSTTREVVWRWLWFAAWFIVGIGCSTSLVWPVWIALLLLLLATVLFLAQQKPARRGLPGLMSGLGVSLIYIAYLSRSGPALVCTPIAGGGRICDPQGSPWPWLAAGVILTVLGVAIFLFWPRFTLAGTNRANGNS